VSDSIHSLLVAAGGIADGQVLAAEVMQGAKGMQPTSLRQGQM
jgi:NAD(P)H-dependent flavin oxidoreductase YrpB (nitropropane dioxygenase family)